MRGLPLSSKHSQGRAGSCPEHVPQPTIPSRSNALRCHKATAPLRKSDCKAATLERQVEAEAEAPEVRVTREILPPPASGQLLDQGTAFCEEHRVRAYEVGPDQRATIVTIANLIQVCSPYRLWQITGRNWQACSNHLCEESKPCLLTHQSLCYQITALRLRLLDHARLHKAVACSVHASDNV